jgi:3-deoxy-manno-octulosonate cytidylyltransferase (CMP-KDO synthetase)
LPERLEKLEQLRALSNGYKIHVDIAAEIPGIGVDTAEDLLKVDGLLRVNK